MLQLILKLIFSSPPYCGSRALRVPVIRGFFRAESSFLGVSGNAGMGDAQEDGGLSGSRGRS